MAKKSKEDIRKELAVKGKELAEAYLGEKEKIRFALKKARESHGLSQEDIGHLLGLSQNAYQAIENGKSKLDLETFYVLDAVLDIKKFVDDDVRKEVETVLTTVNITDYTQVIVQFTRQLLELRNEQKRQHDEALENQKKMENKMNKIMRAMGLDPDTE